MCDDNEFRQVFISNIVNVVNMGLLGGFKGKLIGNKVKKTKNSGSVVCVKFNTFSEFGPSTSCEYTLIIEKKNIYIYISLNSTVF